MQLVWNISREDEDRLNEAAEVYPELVRIIEDDSDRSPDACQKRVDAVSRLFALAWGPVE
jgi:hypothetical protein